MSGSNELYSERFRKLSSINVSDALDALGVHGSTYGIRLMAERWAKIVDPTVIIRMIAAGKTEQKTHLGMNAIFVAEKDDVIVIDNGGRTDTSCWGGVLANIAKAKGISGMMVDGCYRDLDDCMDAGYIVYARGTVVCTARGRVVEESTNQMIRSGEIQVCPGDIVTGDNNDVVAIPQEHTEAVPLRAEEL